MPNDWTFLDLWLDVFAGISRIFAGSFKKKQKGLYYFFSLSMTLFILGTTRQGMLRAVSYVLHAHCRFYLGRFFSLAMGFQDVPRMYYLANFIYMVLQHISIGRGPNGKSTCTTMPKKMSAVPTAECQAELWCKGTSDLRSVDISNGTCRLNTAKLQIKWGWGAVMALYQL